MANPVAAAECVLDELGINAVSDLRLLDEIAFMRGAEVHVAPMDGAEGRVVILGRRAVITVPDRGNALRRRFTVAHELGHVEMHRHLSSMSLCAGEDLREWKSSQEGPGNLEQQANEFAASLLLPERFFAAFCVEGRPALEVIDELATTFEVSLTAAAIRYVEFCPEPVAVVYSSGGRIKWLRRSYDFKERGFFVEPGYKLHPECRAASFFRNGTSSREQRRVRAASWLTAGQYQELATLLEQSWPMPSYDGVLTLLWADREIQDDDDW